MVQPILIIANAVGAAVMTGLATENLLAGIAVAAGLSFILLLVDYTADSVIRGIKR